MQAVGIKVLKNRLSEFVRLAAGGETIFVLDRERVVAELRPVSIPAPVASEEEWKLRAVREGWLRPPLKRLTRPPHNTPMMTLEELLKDLDESRADRDLPG